tara:strand:+ start:707 stop:3070 length:2364 start_codon:yes stop_codon:yes gene_type:complete
MSIFLNLDSSDFLLEYTYYDSASPEIINTTNAPFYLMQNGYDDSSLLMNQDGYESTTNNTRSRSVVQIDAQSKEFALLTTNKLGTVYNDYDSKLTNTSSLPLTFASVEGVKYDTVKIHFIQGFTFNDFFSGIDIDISIKNQEDKKISLLSAIYRVEDNFEIMNPNPFLYSGRQYSSYIEFKIPALRYLLATFDVSSTDNLAYKISNGKGFNANTLLDISAGKFSDLRKLDNQIYTKRISGNVTSISSKDDFSEVGVYVNESASGDFIEFYGTYNGAIFGDYIQSLNNSGVGNHIAIHKLTITEQLPNTVGSYNIVGRYNPLTNIPDLSDNTYLANFTAGNYWVATETGYSSQISQSVSKGNFVVYDPSNAGSIKVDVIDSYDIQNYANISQTIITGEQEFIQDSNFEDSNSFRPVLKFGGSALSYKLNYTLQIFNTSTNSTIEKTGSYVSFEPQKYGKELLKLNTRDNIQVFNVFNKKPITTIVNSSTATISNSIEGTSLYSKNLTAFKQSKNVYSGVVDVSIDVDGNISPKVNAESVTNIKGQGTATVYISPFDTFLQFGLYEQLEDKSFRSIDLNKIGQIFMNFTNKKGEIIKIESTKNQNIDESKGQVLFRVNSELYNQVIDSDSDVFFITSKVGENSPESPIYTGRYKDYAKIVDDEIEILLTQQRQAINDLNSEVTDLEKRLLVSIKENLNSSSTNAELEQKLMKIIKSNLSTSSTNKELEKKLMEAISLTSITKNPGSTANDKAIDDNSMNIKSSTFNPYGPTSVAGPTSNPNRILGPTNR